MRASDLWLGAALLLAGLAILLRARTFPMMAGLPYGPGLFPSIAAVGLMACGGLIALSGWRRGEVAASEPMPSGGWVRMAVVPLSVAFFGLMLDRLGFHLTATAALIALFLAFGLGPLRAVPLSVAAALAIHAVFYSLLRVPLPWGVLTPVAW